MKASRSAVCLMSMAVLMAAGKLVSVKAAGDGVVKGTVKFTGTVPKPTRIDMSDDPKCAKLHPGGASISPIVTDAKGGLDDTVVYVSQGISGQTFDPPAQPVVLKQKGCLYEPRVIAVQAGQKVQVVNADTTTHNIHPIPKNNREWNKSQPPGVPIEETFAREEVSIPVKCNVHPWMKGYIAVFKHPYFAVTDKDGSFEIKNLPPGTYTVQAWHEGLDPVTQNLTIGAADTKTIDFTLKGGS
jgi:plastocyanin